MTNRSKVETLALSAGEYSAARAAFLAGAEALRKAPQVASDAPADASITTSSTSRTPPPHHANSRGNVAGLSGADYQARRAEYLASTK
ncbi:hypothetical protein [Caballeronia telluris]|uniref:Uncharacterized protein n=1 Tax=Caballeronia telluris TaxID=326475 RepID=A0A158KG86_9BURK|nr:hypothetical protein [Caballeronia telluris]SAL80142.1 hypothetical protein AWB66_06187 [Caballeronia telluris]